MEYRYGSHTVFQIEYHFVWVTKYRYKVLKGEVAERVRELLGTGLFLCHGWSDDRRHDKAIFGASF